MNSHALRSRKSPLVGPHGREISRIDERRYEIEHVVEPKVDDAVVAFAASIGRRARRFDAVCERTAPHVAFDDRCRGEERRVRTPVVAYEIRKRERRFAREQRCQSDLLRIEDAGRPEAAVDERRSLRQDDIGRTLRCEQRTRHRFDRCTRRIVALERFIRRDVVEPEIAQAVETPRRLARNLREDGRRRNVCADVSAQCRVRPKPIGERGVPEKRSRAPSAMDGAGAGA